ncbi:hypothetical protein OSB04_003832 [Centaurea solstitialis]|uniref:Protein kinase domain-containing protein n=1 Tax=Centaurea solstitialis TaxID=347529 RepID=A0AA38U634_9ASTR|nr:hypothetical protein OSB04_003832 [Centaurea solstitialis]
MRTAKIRNYDSVLYGGNCLSNVDQKQQHNVSFCHNEALAVMINPPGVSGNDSLKSSSSKVKVVVATSVVGGVVVGGVAVVGVVLVAIRSEVFGGGCAAATPQIRVLLEKVSPAYTMKMLKDARYISETMKLGSLGISAYRTYVMGEIIEATNNFHTSTVIGNGYHGQLYKGQLSDGSMVAIRNLKMKKRCSIQSCTRQIELISKLKHPNLVNPIGHCFDRHPDDSAIIRAVFLLFEFVPNGTLRASLSGEQKLSWAQRLAAAIGISKGIQFLNARLGATILFPNKLKITDVLLDQNFHVKISGYTLPLQPETTNHKVDPRHETSFGRRFDTEEDDERDHVYDLGVIMLELILGRAMNCATDTSIAKDMLQVSLVEDDEVGRRSIVDPLIRKECCCDDESLKNLMELCLRCLSKADRPSIDDVLWNLEFIAQSSSSMEDHSINIQITSEAPEKLE